MSSANPYSNARAAARRANPGANTTQRSWDNYSGKKPIKSWAKKGFYKKGFYNDEEEEQLDSEDSSGPIKRGNITFTPKKKKSSLSESMNQIRDQVNKYVGPKSSTKPKAPSAERDDSDSDLPPGYRLNEDGKVLNTAGYVQDEKWYTIDPKTGKKRMKTPSEAGMYDGGRLYT